MKILLDYQAFLVQKYGGVSRYHATINKHINNLGLSDTSTILQIGYDNEYLEPSVYDFFKYFNYKQGRKWLLSANQALVKRNLKKHDVFHPTFYEPYFLDAPGLPPYVITVHDMIAELYYPKGKEKQAEFKKNMVEKAAGVIVVSEATKNDFLKVFDFPEDKVKVVYHGYPDYFEQYQNNSTSTNAQPYILFIGTRGEYKNFEFFLRAFSHVPKSYGLRIKVAGHKPTADEQQLIRELKLEDVVIFENFVTEKELSNLYKQALCFVFPSLIEGFGMPLLEAFISNCPVICTDIPVFKEVAGDAAIYFEPGKEDDLAMALENVANDKELRIKMIAKGQERVKLFNWKDSAIDTLAAYRSFI
jgi:glycosyltransferase involved in cell wall biosynthesis